MSRAEARTLLFVGECPSVSSDPLVPLLSGLSGRRLEDLAGPRRDEILRRSFFVNLFDVHQVGWYTPGAVMAARDIIENVVRAHPSPLSIVMCGRRVARAFQVRGLCPYLSWRLSRLGEFCVLPHPSPVSRWWNVPENVESARVFVRECL